MSQGVIPPAAQNLCTTTILIVEDDQSTGEFLQRLIEEETPYHTTLVDNGQSALEQVSLTRPCLLLLDYHLPGMNGLELYDRLQDNAEARDIPTIMMSATLPIQELTIRGIYQLRKPMDIGNVLRMIIHALASFEEKQLQEQYNCP